MNFFTILILCFGTHLTNNCVFVDDFPDEMTCMIHLLSRNVENSSDREECEAECANLLAKGLTLDDGCQITCTL